eukprot:scaffold308809_cov16-Prasinocladus_malaysianus.AAC.1
MLRAALAANRPLIGQCGGSWGIGARQPGQMVALAAQSVSALAGGWAPIQPCGSEPCNHARYYASVQPVVCVLADLDATEFFVSRQTGTGNTHTQSHNLYMNGQRY